MFTDTRDGGLELSGDEILADGIIFRDKKSPKDRLEVTIGDGMEFTIHGTFTFKKTITTLNTDIHFHSQIGDSKGNLKRGKNSLNKSRTIANSILEHGDFIGCGIEEDRLSNKSYGSHKHRFKDESHKGSADTLDQDQDEKRDASKEELGIEDGKQIS